MNIEQQNNVEAALHAMGPYARQMSTAMVVLAKAVETALNMRDAAVIEEMKSVSNEIFQQAELALNSDTRNIQ